MQLKLKRFALTSHNLDLYAQRMTQFWDRLGISASILCVLHCLLTPFLVLLTPFASGFLSDKWFHIMIAVIVFPVALWALLNGYRRHHLPRVLVLGGIGLAFIVGALCLRVYNINLEFLFMITGGTFLSIAHFINLRACQSCPPIANRL